MTNVVYFGLPIENRTGRLVQIPIVQFNETDVTNRWIDTSFPTFINERVTYGVSDCVKANESTRQIRRVWKIFPQTAKSFLVKVDSAFDL